MDLDNNNNNSRKNHFLERLIERDSSRGLTKSTFYDDKTVRPVVTPDMIPDRYDYINPDKSKSPSISTSMQSMEKTSLASKNSHESKQQKQKNEGDELSLKSKTLVSDDSSKQSKKHRYDPLRENIELPSSSPQVSKTNSKVSSSDYTVREPIHSTKKEKLSSNFVDGKVDINHDLPKENTDPLSTSTSNSSSNPSAFPNMFDNLDPSNESSKSQNADGYNNVTPANYREKSKDQSSMPSLVPSPIKYSPLSASTNYTGNPIYKLHSEPATINISIGRIEVRAVTSQQKQSATNFKSTGNAASTVQNSSSPPPSSQHSAALSLSEYLKQRSERRY